MIRESIYLHYLNSLLDGDKKQCFQIVEKLIEDKIPLKEIYLKLFQRSMYRIGSMWQNSRCSIADEHIATKITESLIEYVSAQSTNGKCQNKLALITCVDKEFHELGARMVAGFLEAAGWDVVFIGSNTPQKEILNLIGSKSPDIVGISNNYYINISRLVDLISLIKKDYPDQEIIVGGQALSEGRGQIIAKFDKVYYVKSLDDLENFLAALHDN